MKNNDSNSAFLSWEGTIGRKDYAINMLILIVLFVGINLINFNAIAPEKITNMILTFLVQFLLFVIVISVLSVVYRRIVDFSFGRSYKFQQTFYGIFVALFVFPVMYLYVLSYFIGFIPVLSDILGIYSMAAIAIAAVLAIVFCFLKAK